MRSTKEILVLAAWAALALPCKNSLAAKYGSGTSTAQGSSSTSNSKSYAPPPKTSSGTSSSTPRTSSAITKNLADRQKSDQTNAREDAIRRNVQSPERVSGSEKSRPNLSAPLRRTYVVHHYHYRDPYPDAYWSWMLLQPPSIQSQWIYDHQSNMDAARLNDLYAQNAALRGQVASLAGTPVNAAWSPPGYDASLMEEPAPLPTVYPSARVPYVGPSFGHIVWTLCKFVFFGATVVLIVWLVVNFIEWKSTNKDRV